MKTLALERPLIFIMLGHAGAGKSYFARQFSTLFNAPLASYDQVRASIFAEPDFSKDQESVVASIVRAQVEELVKTSKSFIIDGDHGPKVSRMELERIAKKNDYSTLVVWVQTDIATSKIRAMHRSARREGDKYNISMSEEQFDKSTRRINPPTQLEPHVVISGKHTFSAQAKVILKKLVVPREEQLDVPDRNDQATRTNQIRRPSKSSIVIR